MVNDISAYQRSDIYDANQSDLNEDTYDKIENEKEQQKKDHAHYNAYKIQAMRDLDKFLDVLFDRKKAINLFQNGKAKVFNVLDFIFFRYLLHPCMREEVKLLARHKYHEINNQFYMFTYIGASHLCKYHDVYLKESDLPTIWRDRFGVEWANQSLSEIKHYLLNNFFGISDQLLIKMKQEFEMTNK